jgi:hypothetical protein
MDWLARSAFRLAWWRGEDHNRRVKLLEWSFMHCGRRWRAAILNYGDELRRARA